MAGKLQKLLEERKKASTLSPYHPKMEEESSEQLQLLIKSVSKGLLSEIKKLKGEPGENAKTPTPKELISLMRPTIIELVNSLIPTSEEIEIKMKSLLPKAEHGKTPIRGKDYFTKTEIEEFIKAVTPIKGKHYKDGEKGNPGKDAELPDLREFSISIINTIETLEDEEKLDAKAIKNLESVLKNFIIRLITEETSGLYGLFRKYNEGGPGEIFTDKKTILGKGTPTDPLRASTAGLNIAFGEVVDGSGNTFTLANIPVGSIQLFAQGTPLNLAENDYTIIGAVITTALSYSAGQVTASYKY